MATSLFLALLAVTPRPLGDPYDYTDYAMLYNRYGEAFPGLFGAIIFLPPLPGRGEAGRGLGGDGIRGGTFDGPFVLQAERFRNGRRIFRSGLLARPIQRGPGVALPSFRRSCFEHDIAVDAYSFRRHAG